MTPHQWFRVAVPLSLAVGLSMPAIAACQIPEPAIPLATTLSQITELRSAYTDAWNAKIAKAVSAMYTTDAVTIDADGSKTVGQVAIARKFAAEAPTWAHAVVASESVTVYGSTAIDIGVWKLHPKPGEELVARYLAVLRRDNNGWKLQYVAVVPVPK